MKKLAYLSCLIFSSLFAKCSNHTPPQGPPGPAGASGTLASGYFYGYTQFGDFASSITLHPGDSFPFLHTSVSTGCSLSADGKSVTLEKGGIWAVLCGTSFTQFLNPNGTAAGTGTPLFHASLDGIMINGGAFGSAVNSQVPGPGPTLPTVAFAPEHTLGPCILFSANAGQVFQLVNGQPSNGYTYFFPVLTPSFQSWSTPVTVFSLTLILIAENP